MIRVTLEKVDVEKDEKGYTRESNRVVIGTLMIEPQTQDVGLLANFVRLALEGKIKID